MEPEELKQRVTMASLVLVVIGTVAVIVGMATGLVEVGGSCGSAFNPGNPYLMRAGGCDVLEADARREAVQLIVGGISLALISLIAAGFARQKLPASVQREA